MLLLIVLDYRSWSQLLKGYDALPRLAQPSYGAAPPQVVSGYGERGRPLGCITRLSYPFPEMAEERDANVQEDNSFFDSDGGKSTESNRKIEEPES
ncbi:unnamed protein product [Eruca vesicaria subsp. sativa]|uniref:Uncharacterized protein n=1 Tax=Eruca vesicaria subsp. sativa TaxID=29727 RepID=A0ABC8KR06_ERUVS|nr:unnamed protein product [Eruca vesicaria subsp. sativa]